MNVLLTYGFNQKRRFSPALDQGTDEEDETGVIRMMNHTHFFPFEIPNKL